MIDDCQLCGGGTCSGLIAPNESNLQVQVCFFWQRKELLMDSSFSVKHECQTKKHLGLYSTEFPARRLPAMEALWLGTYAAYAWILFPKFRGANATELGILPRAPPPFLCIPLPPFSPSNRVKPPVLLPKAMPSMAWLWVPTLPTSTDSASESHRKSPNTTQGGMAGRWFFRIQRFRTWAFFPLQLVGGSGHHALPVSGS